jgi:hypothetical protein
LPFKVNALSGDVGKIISYNEKGPFEMPSNYTTNWAPTLELFLSLIELNEGDTTLYSAAFDKLLNWMVKYPLNSNRWGPFFEDINRFSDTQINAITFAQFMMNHQEYFPEWKSKVKNIFDWVYQELGNKIWEKYGVIAINEQTAYKVPGNSHTSRQASAELQYAKLTGDTSRIQHATLQLNWATYMVDLDGKNRYPKDEAWLTDGYGDYVRHYLRSMEYYPELAPSGQNHLISSTSEIELMEYNPIENRYIMKYIPEELLGNTLIHYRTFDDQSVEKFKLVEKPSSVYLNLKIITENKENENGWTWEKLSRGGLLTVRHVSGNDIIIVKKQSQ